jgi:hypothetical protein
MAMLAEHLDAVVLRTDQNRKSDTDHIACYFTFEAEVKLDCN